MSVEYPHWNALVYACFVIGAFTLLCLAALLLFGIGHFFYRTWFTKRDPDIHPSILCTCPSPKCSRHPHRFGNRTAAMPVSEFDRRNET